MKGGLFKGLAAALLVALAGLWASLNLEWVEEPRRSGMSRAAREDDHLALKRLVEASGHTARTVAALSELAHLPADASLLAAGLSEQPIYEQILPRLDAWVRAGGHLLLVTPGYWQDERLVSHFGVTMLGAHSRASDRLRLEGRELDAQLGRCDVFSLDRPPLWSATVRGYRTRSEEDAEEDEEGAQVPDRRPAALAAARFAWGAGQVTVACADRFLLNAAIGEADHAELALRLLLADATREVVFLPDPGKEIGLAGWLWEHARPALLAAAGLLALALWAAIPRFGAPVAEAPPARPGVGRHLAAVAAFLLRRRAFEALLSAPREELLALVEARSPGLPRDEALARAAGVAGIAPEHLRQAMERAAPDRRTWRSYAGLLQRASDALRAMGQGLR